MRGENMRSGFLQQCDDLFALHARKTFKKLLDRISCFQMIEEALRRHPRARKHWLASKHLGILRNDAAHAANVKIKMNRKPAGCIRPFPSSFIRHTSYFRRLLQDGENAVLGSTRLDGQAREVAGERWVIANQDVSACGRTRPVASWRKLS